MTSPAFKGQAIEILLKKFNLDKLGLGSTSDMEMIYDPSTFTYVVFAASPTFTKTTAAQSGSKRVIIIPQPETKRVCANRKQSGAPAAGP